MTDTFSIEERRRIMQSVKVRHTKPEMQVRSAIHQAGFRFSLHRKDLPGKPDIVLPKYRMAVFVNGCFWHGHNCRRGKLPDSNAAFWKKKIADNMQRDGKNKTALQATGWNVHFVWQCTLEKDTQRLLRTLARKRRTGSED